MALNPMIPLSGRVPQPLDVQGAFSSALSNVSKLQNIEEQPFRNRLLDVRTQVAEQELSEKKDLARFTSVSMGAAEIVPLLEAGNVDGAMTTLINRRDRNEEEGKDNVETNKAIELLRTDPNALLDGSKNLVNQAVQAGVFEAPGSKFAASAKSEFLPGGGTRQIHPDGSTVITNKLGQVVEGQERIGLLESSAAFEVEQKQRLTDIDVSASQKKAISTARASRASDMKREMGQRNRNAAREAIKLNAALFAADNAEQGVAGALKLQLAKLFPDIDVTNEAALDSALLDLTLDQLQKFKGPTTDFEFNKAEGITGSIGDSQSANIAKLKGLQRNNWFNKREFEQFSKHVGAGGDPDAFAFNFGETIKTKKGIFTLKDIQDAAAGQNSSIEDAIKRLNKI